MLRIFKSFREKGKAVKDDFVYEKSKLQGLHCENVGSVVFLYKYLASCEKYLYGV